MFNFYRKIINYFNERLMTKRHSNLSYLEKVEEVQKEDKIIKCVVEEMLEKDDIMNLFQNIQYN